jgi:hypothetical protein
MSNDSGICIQPLLRSSKWNHTTILRYAHRNFEFEFHACRSPENWIDYQPNGTTGANFALGSVCLVWIDDRRMRHESGDASSAPEFDHIKDEIADFLKNACPASQLAVAPYAERAEFR